jgi:iron(III) transport system permease protein
MRSSSTKNPDPILFQRLGAFVLLSLCAAPLVTLVLKGAPRLFEGLLVHLFETVMPTQLGTSILVAVGTVFAGTIFALGGVLCALFEFPGHRVLARVQLAPLLIPGWYLSVLYHDELGVTGLAPLVVIGGVSLAPLFQLLITASLRNVPSRSLESLQLLGHRGLLPIARPLLPLTLPAYAAAAVLVFFLSWADEASARTLAVPTLTVGLFDQWFGRQDDAAGAPLALLLVGLSLFPAAALWLWLTRGQFQPTARLQGASMRPAHLGGAGRFVPWLASAPLLIIGVLFPAWVIARWTSTRLRWVDLTTLGSDLVDSLVLALGCTLSAAVLALLLLHQQVVARTVRLNTATTVVMLSSFAVPPLVLALAWLWMLPERVEVSWVTWLNDTPIPLVIALGLRYAAVFLLAGRAALLRVARAHGEVLRVYGLTGLVTFLRLFRPFLVSSLAAVACLVFLAALQDLSVSQVLQPFGFTTISTRVYQYAQSQRIADCAVWILCQALIGVYPLALLARWAERSQDRRSNPTAAARAAEAGSASP